MVKLNEEIPAVLRMDNDTSNSRQALLEKLWSWLFKTLLNSLMTFTKTLHTCQCDVFALSTINNDRSATSNESFPVFTRSFTSSYNFTYTDKPSYTYIIFSMLYMNIYVVANFLKIGYQVQYVQWIIKEL